MKEGGADAERKGKLKVEDLKINTVFNMHCEQKKNIKDRTRNVNIVKKNTTIQQDTRYLLDRDFDIVSYR